MPLDPLFPSQWHLQNPTPGFLDLNVVDVWSDYTGVGVEVAVVDDAVQWSHPDLLAHYSRTKDWDFTNEDTDPTGLSTSSHGTAVAGIIAANANGIGGVGVAHNATLFGFQVDTFLDIMDAIDNASGFLETGGVNREADVVNLSLGSPSDIFFDQYLRSVMPSLNLVIDDAVAIGRNGLGTILVKSAGNARTRNQDNNASSWSANPHTISVAAVEQDGFVSSFSTHGASILVSAFGTSGQVVTTDRVGPEGYTPTDYTNTFSGTSAAAPMVSGVVALMLEANPNLGWRDVQAILAYSARHVGTAVGAGISGYEEYAWTFNGATHWNGGGLHFSNDYGFGLVDAKAAVRLAETWGTVPQTTQNQAIAVSDFLDEPTLISYQGTTLSQTVNSALALEYVEVEADFSQWYDPGDLTLLLTSPAGTTSVLINNSGNNDGDASNGFSGRWEFFSHAFRGETTAGTWTVQLIDADNPVSSPITITDLDLTFYGTPPSEDDTFIFTEEYADYAGQFGHATVIAGGMGTDLINAAAIDTTTIVDLSFGSGWIDGINVGISGIENIVTGDGNDAMRGDSANNQLSGMRGNDFLAGEAGTDRLFGGDGNDILVGGSGSDILEGGNGMDRLIGVNFNQGQAGLGEYDVLTGGTGSDIFILGDWFGAYYAQLGYAIISDFNWLEGDRVQVHGTKADYSLGITDGIGAAAQDTLMYYQSNLIGIVQDTTNVSLDWNFTYV